MPALSGKGEEGIGLHSCTCRGQLSCSKKGAALPLEDAPVAVRCAVATATAAAAAVATTDANSYAHAAAEDVANRQPTAAGVAAFQ
eukprot:scaffold105259_cov16-Tisochrysis_lutea.AAC.2